MHYGFAVLRARPIVCVAVNLCGIAGFTDEEIAPLFRTVSKLQNVCLLKNFGMNYMTELWISMLL